ncbi:MAG: DapH/DapD/GlmU-related protein [Lachnospiraceae bacterium]|nr:DapH/DapD/GlmU-related protein [Lachnospiraceae bacterium]
MRLKEVFNKLNRDNLILLRDAEFDTINYCTSEETRRFIGFLEKEKFLDKINPNMKCVICKNDFVDKLPKEIEGVIISNEPKADWYRIYDIWAKEIKVNEMRKPSQIGINCDISRMAYVAENNVKIGNNVTIEPFACIHENVTIGDNCIIHSGTIVGGRSFSKARTENEVLELVDLGQTVLEKNVELYSHVHIANGILPSDITYIGENSKLDAHIYVGHGTKLGKKVFIAAGAVLAGNCVIGDNVWIGVNATVSNRIIIGNNARVSLGAVVTKNVGESETVTGNFAINHEKFISLLRNYR